MKKAVVIGSGIGGIAAAIRLRAKGFAVDVFEQNSYPGGKLSEIKHGGFRFDAGPSLFTMPWLVDELFSLSGKSPKDYFDYDRMDTLCHYFWEDGTMFIASAEKQEFIKSAAKIFSESADHIEDYLNRSKEKYDLTAGLFLEKSLHKIDTYLSKETVKGILAVSKLNVLRSLNSVNDSTFQSDKLVQFFNRYATYNGSSPYKTPGIMSMIPHLEMNLGTFFPKGGMHSITQSLYKLSRDIGIAYHFNCSVKSINYKKRKVNGITTNKGLHRADIVVSNMDVFGTYKYLMPQVEAPKATMRQEKSSSALIFYWGMNRDFPELDLHNIFFSDNYQREFDAIFNKKSLSEDPTVYINISSKRNPSDAPDGKENWFVMINTPANYGQDWDKLISETRALIIKKIERILGKPIESLIESESILDPRSIETKTASHKGSIYGASSNSRFSAFLRHPNFSSKIDNLYFCGGSVHPGGGIPLSLLSAKIVDDLIK